MTSDNTLGRAIYYERLANNKVERVIISKIKKSERGAISKKDDKQRDERMINERGIEKRRERRASEERTIKVTIKRAKRRANEMSDER